MTNIIKMKKSEILWELPKSDPETESEQMMSGEMVWIDLLEAGLPQTFHL